MFEIEYTRTASQDLASFKKHEQQVILQAVDTQLRYEPTVVTRNRFMLEPNETADWELRIGDFRVFYDVDEIVYVVSIQRIGEKKGNRIYFRGRRGEL